MRYFIAINLLITAGIAYVLWNASPGESCNAEGIILLLYTFTCFATVYALLMLLGFRRKSAILVLLAGAALWFPLAVVWHSVCGHESYSWGVWPLSFLILPPMGIGYAYARKEVGFFLLLLYFLAMTPAIIYLA